MYSIPSIRQTGINWTKYNVTGNSSGCLDWIGGTSSDNGWGGGDSGWGGGDSGGGGCGSSGGGCDSGGGGGGGSCD